MSARCQVTGRVPGFGKAVSHSHVRIPRRWNPNIQRRAERRDVCKEVLRSPGSTDAERTAARSPA